MLIVLLAIIATLVVGFGTGAPLWQDRPREALAVSAGGHLADHAVAAADHGHHHPRPGRGGVPTGAGGQRVDPPARGGRLVLHRHRAGALVPPRGHGLRHGRPAPGPAPHAPAPAPDDGRRARAAPGVRDRRTRAHAGDLRPDRRQGQPLPPGRCVAPARRRRPRPDHDHRAGARGGSRHHPLRAPGHPGHAVDPPAGLGHGEQRPLAAGEPLAGGDRRPAPERGAGRGPGVRARRHAPVLRAGARGQARAGPGRARASGCSCSACRCC